MDLKEFDKIAEFKPFYSAAATERMLMAYRQGPHLFKPELVSQLKDHAAFHNIEFQEPDFPNPKDSEFSALNAVKQMGEGFISGFSTFNVGEPSDNEYERIARSVGQLAGFVGYVGFVSCWLNGWQILC